jgi:hypothetical protein
MVIVDRRLKIGEGEDSCPFDGVVKLVDALDGREIGLDCFNLGTGPPESFGGGINLRLIGNNDSPNNKIDGSKTCDFTNSRTFWSIIGRSGSIISNMNAGDPPFRTSFPPAWGMGPWTMPEVERRPGNYLGDYPHRPASERIESSRKLASTIVLNRHEIIEMCRIRR